MTSRKKIAHFRALEIATDLIHVLRPGCERIAIAGSIRRMKSEIGDIELVAIPRVSFVPDMFGNLRSSINHLEPLLNNLSSIFGQAIFIKNGPKQKQIDLGIIILDLFLTTVERWPVIYTIRTGSAEFSKWLVTKRRFGGALPWGMEISDGYLWKNGENVPLATEKELFAAVGLPWIEPEDRQDNRWLKKIREREYHG